MVNQPAQKTPVKHCTIKMLPPHKWVAAAARAIELNHFNAPALRHFQRAMPGVDMPKERLAVLTTKYWGIGGVKLTVGFLDNPSAELRRKILSHMNAWGKFCNVKFIASNVNPLVRISRSSPAPADGYWSYMGTEILDVDKDEPTMNLDGFTMKMEDSEFYRVLRHEAGHTLGFPHEHSRIEIVNGIDAAKAIAYYKKEEGWTKKDVMEQVLTPEDSSALNATAKPDPKSIMCYWLPAEIMKNGKEVAGGGNINKRDAKFAASVYPKKKK